MTLSLRKTFGSKPRNAIEAVLWAKKDQKFDALKQFIADDGKFDPSVRYQKGNELFYVAWATEEEGLRFFFDNGGVITPGGQFGAFGYDIAYSEIMLMADTGNPNLLEKYLKHGGELNPELVDVYSASEAMIIADRLGSRGLRLFRQYGGEFRWDRKDENGQSEADYVLEVKIKEEKPLQPDIAAQRYVEALAKAPAFPKYIK